MGEGGREGGRAGGREECRARGREGGEREEGREGKGRKGERRQQRWVQTRKGCWSFAFDVLGARDLFKKEKTRIRIKVLVRLAGQPTSSACLEP